MSKGNGDDFVRLAKRIEKDRDEMVAMQCELTAIQALGPESGGAGELERAQYLKRKLQEYGFGNVIEINCPDPRVPSGVRPNLVARVAGERTAPVVWVMSHMDTVPPGEASLWEGDPFRAVVREGRIIGRGVEDNQQGLVSSLFAARALLEEGVRPTTDVGLILVADEETGSRFGIDHVLHARADLIGTQDIVIVPDAGTGDGSMIEVAEKSILWCRFVVQGRQVHASTPHLGRNAHRAAAFLVTRLDKELHAAFPKDDPVFDPPVSTFEPTRHDANVPNVNTIPGEEHLYFDCRVLPDYDLDKVIALIRGVVRGVEEEFGVTVSLDHPAQSQAAPATPSDAPVVRFLAEAIRQVRQVEPKAMGIGGGTVAALFRRRGIPVAVWSTLEDCAHQPNEYCIIDNMVEDAKVFAHVFTRRGV